MTSTEAPESDALAPSDAADQTSPDVTRPPRGEADRQVGRFALAVTLAPFVVGAVALLLAVGNQYHPASDHALIELQTRSVGRDEVLVGLYSRETWNHPGPVFFYLMAPFYWLTGGMSVGINVGALAVNAASVAGMGFVARRRGGTPLMLLTLVGCGLLMRMLGGDFLGDPWNCFVTTLPFGLLIFLSWSMWRGEMWAFPVGAAVATFLAQTHVGFVAIATPVLAWGVVGLVVSSARGSEGTAGPGMRRRAVRAGAVGAAVLVLGWLPVAIDVLMHAPSNAREIVDYFRHPGEEARTLADGWRVMAGQFGGAPEWLTYKRDPGFGGQSQLVDVSPFPWMLVVLVGAGAILWRRDVAGSRSLLATVTVTFAAGVVAVARTVGLAYDYRLRWTLIPGMVAFVIIGWAGWVEAAERWPRAGSRVLTPLALAVLAVLGGVNAHSAATAGTPQDGDSAVVRSLFEQVLDSLPDDVGTVLVTDRYRVGAWYARGVVLQLERHGVDADVEASVANEYGRHRVSGRADADVVLLVSQDAYVEVVAARPDVRMIAEWSALPDAEVTELEAEREQIDADHTAGRVSLEETIARHAAVAERLTNDGRSTAYRVAVFVVESSDGAAIPPG